MTETINTKVLKAHREKVLDVFLEQVKSDGSWRQWLNPSNELYITKICKHLGGLEPKGKSWDTTCFRDRGWAAPYKNSFNKWVKNQLEYSMYAQQHTDLLSNPLRTSLTLPTGLTFDGLSDEMANFIRGSLAEIKRQKNQVKELQSRLDLKEIKMLELETELSSIMDRVKANDDHFRFCVRTLHYD